MNKKIGLVFSLLTLVILAQTVCAVSDFSYLIEIEDTSFLPSTIHAGDTVSLAVDVHDRGTVVSIEDLNGVLDIGNLFEAIDLEDNIPLIKPGSTKTLVFKFKVRENTLPGYYPVFLTMNYVRNDGLVRETQSINVPVSHSGKNLEVTIEPKVINPGNQTEVTFSIKNIAGTMISNIAFYWDEENDLVLPLGSDNKRYVSELESNEEIALNYTVAADPNIEPGIYPLDVTLSFTDFNGTQTQTSEVGLIVGGGTDFEVSAEMLNTGQLSISIANVGSNNAGAVVAKIPNQEGIRINGSSTAILGNLNKGDFTLANFEMRSTDFMQRQQPTQDTQPSGFGNARNLLLEINYTDTTGERHSVQKTIELNQSFSGTQDASMMSSGLRGRMRQSTDYSLIAWILLVSFVGGGFALNKFKAGNSNWKKLWAILAAILVLFLITIFLLNSDIAVLAIVSIVSLALLAWFFQKLDWIFQKLFKKEKSE